MFDLHLADFKKFLHDASVFVKKSSQAPDQTDSNTDTKLSGHKKSEKICEIEAILSKLKLAVATAPVSSPSNSLSMLKTDETCVTKVGNSHQGPNVKPDIQLNGPIHTTSERYLIQTQTALTNAKGLIRSQIEQISAQFQHDLSNLEGIPRGSSIFEILDVQNKETCYQGVLAWLLDPNGSHGLNDIFLRHFLSALGVSLRGDIFRPTPFVAIVHKEFRISLPKEFMQRVENQKVRKADSLRVDIMIFTRNTWITIECKVDASESIYRYDGRDHKQSVTYLDIFKRMMRHLKTQGQGSPVDYMTKSMLHTFESHNGQDAWGAINGANRVIGCLIDNANQESNEDIKHITWVKIASIILKILKTHPINARAQAVIEDFASAALQHANDGDLKRTLDHVNLIQASPHFIQKFPLRTFLELSSATTKINQFLKVHTATKTDKG
jgi:hypothetical protein